MATWTAATKNTASWSQGTKNSATWTNLQEEGGETYDSAYITYDEADKYYDGNLTSWTFGTKS